MDLGKFKEFIFIFKNVFNALLSIRFAQRCQNLQVLKFRYLLLLVLCESMENVNSNMIWLSIYIFRGV